MTAGSHIPLRDSIVSCACLQHATEQNFSVSAGRCSTHREGFRTHIQFRNEAEEQKHIYGPNRDTEKEAQKDLDQIRAAGAVGTTREEGLKIMVAEARRIQIYADYQAQIKQTVQRMASKEVGYEG